MHTRSRKAIVALWVAVTALAGCSFLKPHADPTRFYVLTAMSANATVQPAAHSVGVQRIALPDYLDRPELATRLASNELKISEYDRWAEPLKDGFTRTLRRDLALLVGADHVVEPPWDQANPPDLILDLEVHRFERVGTDHVELEAGWTLRDGRSGTTVITRQTQLRQAVAGSDTQATVAALSQALGALAGQIADAVRQRR